MKKRKTNIEFVKDLMNFSPYGALSQIFVIQAIEHYAKEVNQELTDKWLDENDKNEEGKIPLVCNRAWRGVADNIIERLKQQYHDNL